MGRLRRRLDALQGHAHASMTDAQTTLAIARDLLADLQDGVGVKLVNTGEGTVLDFLTGKIKTLPLQIVIDPREDG